MTYRSLWSARFAPAAALMLLAVAPFAFAGGEEEQSAAAGAAEMTMEAADFGGREQEPSARAAGVTSFAEAPMLAARVAAGELPALEERLPPDPAVVFPVHSVGVYGGELRRIDIGGRDQMLNHEPLTRWSRNFVDVLPNLVDSWEFSADGTVLTYHYKPGVKWSDGAPHTVDDFLFYWNDIVLSDDIGRAPEAFMRFGGELMEVEKIDDHTLQFTFAAPNPLFNRFMNRGFYHSARFNVPAHYMKRFHPAYTEGASGNDLIDRMNEPFKFTDMPQLTAWISVDYQPDQVLVSERNPYYWKVDPQGQQLPYVDRLITNEIPPDQPEIRLLKVINGEVDLGLRPWFGNVDDIPVVIENAEKAGYTVYRYSVGTVASGGLVIPKFEHADPKVSALMFDRNFRQALSHAINRERILQVIFKGFGKPRQFSLPGIGPQFQTPEGEAFIEEWGQSYIEYDPELAKRLLDEAGITDRDGDGWRDYPDGSELDILVDAAITTATTAELVEQDWEAVGLKISLNVVAGELWAQRALNAEAMISLRGGGASSGMVVANAHWVPTQYASWALAPQVGLWYATGGEQGFDPRGTFLEELYELYAKAISTVDEDERNRLGLEAARLHVTEGPIQISMIDSIPAAAIARKDVRNIQEFALVGSWHLNYPGIISPEQFYIEQ